MQLSDLPSFLYASQKSTKTVQTAEQVSKTSYYINVQKTTSYISIKAHTMMTLVLYTVIFAYRGAVRTQQKQDNSCATVGTRLRA